MRTKKQEKYRKDFKSSVGLNNKRTAAPALEHTQLPRVVKSRFERKGRPSTGNLSTVKCSAARVKLTAAQKWTEEILSMGLRMLRKNYMDRVKTYTPKGSRNAFNDDANAEKNRYEDVELLDRTRVKLTTVDDDYIHASYVKIHDKLTVICTQGPMDNTVASFWVMVAEQRSKVILQLCKNMEDDKEKCVEYIPLKEGSAMEFGPVKVRVVAANVDTGALETVTQTLVEVSYNGNVFETTHLLYAGWPDHSVPLSLSTYLELRNLIFRLCGSQPIIAHCSAGIGRTGSFTSIELAVHRLVEENDKNFSIFDAICQVRDQRMHSVQNDLQFCFVVRMVLEILLNRGLIERTTALSKFFKHYDDLIRRKRMESTKTK